MKKLLITFSLIMWSCFGFAQNDEEQEKILSGIIDYVQETQNNDIFEVQNIETINDQNEDIITTYYFDEDRVFCIINKTFDEKHTEIAHYFRENQLVLSIIRENKGNNEVFYFVENDTLINLEDSTEKYPFEEIIAQAKKLLDAF